MPLRARVHSRALPRPRAPGNRSLRRKRRSKQKHDPSRYLPTHERYTPELLAHVRQRFEQTPERMASMAADLGIVPQSLHRIARRYGWVRRNREPPLRDLPAALRILEAAKALEAGGIASADSAAVVGNDTTSLPPLEKGRSRSEATRVGINGLPSVTPTRQPSAADPGSSPGQALPLSGGGMAVAQPGAVAAAAAVAPAAESTASPPPLLSTIERLERAVLAELATIEAMRAALGTLPQKPPGAARTVRTLSMLTQTLQHLQRLRASQALEMKPAPASETHDDDIPADIEQFRFDLARRIDAFVASRSQPAGAGGDLAAAVVDDA